MTSDEWRKVLKLVSRSKELEHLRYGTDKYKMKKDIIRRLENELQENMVQSREAVDASC